VERPALRNRWFSKPRRVADFKHPIHFEDHIPEVERLG